MNYLTRQELAAWLITAWHRNKPWSPRLDIAGNILYRPVADTQRWYGTSYAHLCR